MKVCLDVSAIHRSDGIGRYTSKLAEHLSRIDLENTYSFFYGIGRIASSRHSRNTESSWQGHWSRKLYDLALILAHKTNWTMDRLFDDVDIVHFTDYVAPPLKKARSVITIQDLSFLLYPQLHTRQNRLKLQILVPSMVRRANLIIVPSESTRKDLTRLLHIPENKVVVLPHGIDEQFRPASKEAVTSVNKKYNTGGRFILALGTIEPRKNIGRLIEAYALLHSWQIPHRLVIAGRRGWLQDDLEAMRIPKGLAENIIIPGFIPEEDMVALYTAASVLAYPSIYEGFGLPPLEAMACGTPVICSNSSSLPEVVGDAAVQVDPSDSQALAHALREMLEDEVLRASFQEKGLARARLFSWDETARKTIDAYQTCLKGR